MTRTTKKTKTKNPTADVGQIIERARSLRPAARADFLRRHAMAEVIAIHTALLGQTKPKTPRPVLEKRILAALAELPPPAKTKPAPDATATAENGTDEPARPDDTKEAPLEGGTDTQAAEQTPPADYVDPEFAKALAARKARKPTSDPRLPPVGTLITKLDRHGNERARCTVIEGGIEYGGITYRSISAAALAAAKDLGLGSKTQDGYAFWGLKKVSSAAKRDPMEGIEKAWARYRDRAATAAKIEDDDQRVKVHAALRLHLSALGELLAGEGA